MPQKTTEYSKRNRILKQVITWLSVLVVFCTTYALILPALTLEKTTYCGQDEHKHTDSCYEMQLVCDEEHEHTDECYQQALVCGKKEHEHTDECHSNSKADVERTPDWEKTMAEVELKGDWDKDLLALAGTQIGYTESTANYAIDDNEEKKGYTRYGDWYGDAYGDWDAMFVSFCLNYAEIPAEYFPQDADCQNWIKTLSSEAYGLYHKSGEYTPVAGDIVFFDCDNDKKADHVGIVEELAADKQNESTEIKTIEGDSEDAVKKQTYDIKDGKIMGYGQLPEEPADLAEKTAADKEADKNGNNDNKVFTYEDKDIKVTATYMGEGTLPEDAELVVKPYDKDDDTYAARLEEAYKFLKENSSNEDAQIESFSLYDIHFESDGREVEPDGTVNVQMVMTGVKDEEEVPNQVIHFAEKEIELMETAVTEEDDTVTLEFETETFSDYAVNYYGGAPVAYFVRNNGYNAYYGNLADIKPTVNRDWGGYYVTTPSAETINTPYQYRLNGWYDFNHNEYYAPNTKVYINEHTVFYADWVAANYNATSSNSIYTPDTGSFIRTDVFDYNDLFNMNSITLASGSQVSASGHTENWTLTKTGDDTMTRSATLNFVFFDTRFKDKHSIFCVDGREGGRTGNAQADKGLNYYEGIITPGISATNGLLDKVFSPQDGLGKKHIGSDNHLYQYDDKTGYYYYDSVRNSAAYNQSQHRFYVYDNNNRVMTAASRPNDNTEENQSDFLPFNDGNNYTGIYNGRKEYGNKNNSVDYWFGMKSEISFYLPNSTGEKDSYGNYGNQSSKAEDMIFKFAGDDDVWVYVDGELVLDLGGVHDITYGEINFATGEVKRGQNGAPSINYPNDNSGTIGKMGVSDIGDNTVLYDKLNLGEGEHKLTIYYLERGASQSNCAIYFNLSPRYSFEITKKDQADSKYLAGAEFEIYSDVECTKPAKLWDSESAYRNGAESKNSFTVGQDGKLHAWGLTTGRDYYVKEVDPPQGYKKATNEIIHLNISNKGNVKYDVIGHDDSWPFVTDYNQDDQLHTIAFTVQNETIPARYALDLTKKDQETKKLLSGAEFAVFTDSKCEHAAELYDSEDAYNKGETAKNTFTVGDDGQLHAWGLYERANYYIKEVKAPAGYQEALTEVIHLDLSKSGGYDVSGHDQAKKWDFVTDYSKDDTNHKILFTVQNEAKDALVVDKKWFDIDGNDITDSVDNEQIQFKLYQIASTERRPDTGNVTVRMILNIPTWGQYVVTSETTVQKGSTVRCSFATPLNQAASTTNMSVSCTLNGKNASVTQTNQNVTTGGWTHNRKVFTLNDIVADRDIEVVVSPTADEWLFQKDEHNAEYNIQVVKTPTPSTEPDPTPTTKELGTYSISKDNDWQWVSDELPTTEVKDGNRITYNYYVVEEPVEYYSAEYDNNSGISKGTITIKNTQTEVLSYELPHTGGSGTLPYTIGGLMLIALSGILLYRKNHRREDCKSS